MAKAKHKTLFKSSWLIVGGIGLALALGVSLIALQSKDNSDVRSRAADPCSAYPKLTAVTTGSGTVHDKTDNGFNWWQNGISNKVKVVIVCAGAKITRQFLADIPYSDILEGDTVQLSGNYGDTTKTTILAKGVRDLSTSVAREYNSTVATVNHPQSSFTLSAITMVRAGVTGKYTLNVKYTTGTKCYFQTKQTSLPCTSIAVGNRVAVRGVVYDPTLTLTASAIIINPSITLPTTTPSAKTCVQGFDCTQCGSHLRSSPASTTGSVDQIGSNANTVANCYRQDNSGAACCSCLNNGQCAGYWDCVGSGDNLNYDARCAQSR